MLCTHSCKCDILVAYYKSEKNYKLYNPVTITFDENACWMWNYEAKNAVNVLVIANAEKGKYANVEELNK